MPGSPTPNKTYALPTVFGDLDAWGAELNSNFSIIDLNVGGTLPMTLSGSTATVSGTNVEYGGYKFTGTLAGTNTITWTSYAGPLFVSNGTTGGQNILCGISGGLYATVQPNETAYLWSDTANFYKTAVVGGGVGTTGTGVVVLASGATLTNPTLVNPSGAVPTGTIIMFGANVAPTGWLYCDGSAVSRTSFAALFAVIGTSFGAGNGTTSFNIPDFRGRSGVGFDSGNATGRMTGLTGGVNASAIGNNGGEQAHVLVVAELAIHNHGITDPSHNHNHADPGHAHSISDPGHGHGINDPTHAHGVADPQHVHGLGDPGHAHGVSDPGHAHGVSDPQHRHLLQGNVNDYGGGVGVDGFSDRAPNAAGQSVAIYENPVSSFSGTGIGIFGAGTGIGIFGSGTGMFMGYAATGIGIFGAATNISIQGAGTNIGIFGAFTGISNVAATTNITINSAGSSTGHNNVQPGLVVGFIIKT